MKNTHSPALVRILEEFERRKDPANVLGMARFGISSENTYGIAMPVVRAIAKQYKKNHALALELWATGIHEARILASLVDDPGAVTKKQMKAWARDFDSWDVVDGCCNNLFVRTPFAHEMAVEWSANKKEYIRRAGFVLMAVCAVHDGGAPNDIFEGYFSHIIAGAADERNFVKKAVNWALRQMGKRNETLRAKAIDTCRILENSASPSARWIARDALRELTDPRTRMRNRFL